MIDWSEEIAGKYELNVVSARRGRGSWIFETDRGLKLLKEYKGSVRRLEFEEAVLDTVKDAGTLKVDQYVRNKEGSLVSAAGDGTRYLVKDWFSDPECNLRDKREIFSAVRRIALLHRHMRSLEPREEWNLKSMIAPPLYENMEKHNRELKRARMFIRGKRKKSEFELAVIAGFDEFFSQAKEASEAMRLVWEKSEEKKRTHICHGDMDQHHVLIGDLYVAVTGFNKMHLGVQMEDLYSFVRKVMEKHDWDPLLGKEMLDVYERVLPMTEEERQVLYCLFLYPEKYWKQINFYYNSNKARIPAKSTEKIETLMRQQGQRMEFLSRLLP